MNRLAFAAAILVPSIASAHPGHSHEGMSSHHHLITAAAIGVAALVGGYFVSRYRQMRSEKSLNNQ